MFIKDYFLHSTYADDQRKISILKSDIIGYEEMSDGTTKVHCKNTGCIISMSYDDVKKELTETVC